MLNSVFDAGVICKDMSLRNGTNPSLLFPFRFGFLFFHLGRRKVTDPQSLVSFNKKGKERKKGKNTKKKKERKAQRWRRQSCSGHGVAAVTARGWANSVSRHLLKEAAPAHGSCV